MIYNKNIKPSDMDVILAKVRWDTKKLDQLNDNGLAKVRDYLSENNIYYTKEQDGNTYLKLNIFNKYDSPNKFNSDIIENWLNSHIEQFNYITGLQFKGDTIYCSYDKQSLGQLMKTCDKNIFNNWIDDIDSLIELRNILQEKLLGKVQEVRNKKDYKKPEDNFNTKQDNDKEDKPKQEEKKGFFDKFKKNK